MYEFLAISCSQRLRRGAVPGAGGGIAAGAMGIGKILFVVFAVLAVASFLFSLITR